MTTTPPTLDAELAEARAASKACDDAAQVLNVRGLSIVNQKEHLGGIVRVLRLSADTIDSLIARVEKGEARWRDIKTAPLHQLLLTCRADEGGPSVSWTLDGDEWCAPDGRTTVTHHTYLPPTHWLCVVPPIPSTTSTPPLKETECSTDSANTGSNSVPSSQAGTGEGAHDWRPAHEYPSGLGLYVKGERAGIVYKMAPEGWWPKLPDGTVLPYQRTCEAAQAALIAAVSAAPNPAPVTGAGPLVYCVLCIDASGERTHIFSSAEKRKAWADLQEDATQVFYDSWIDHPERYEEPTHDGQ